MDVQLMLPARSVRYIAKRLRPARRNAIQPRDELYRSQLKQRMLVNDELWQTTVTELQRINRLKNMYASQRRIENWIGVLAFISILGESAIMKLYWSYASWVNGLPDAETAASLTLTKAFLTVVTVTLVVLIYFRYDGICAIEVTSGQLDPRTRLYHRAFTKRWLYMLETIVFVVHMLPRLDYTVLVHQYISAATEGAIESVCATGLLRDQGHCYVEIAYNLNQFGLVVLVRVYVFGRLVRNVLGFNTNSIAFLGAIHNVKSSSPFFSIKYLFHVYPAAFASLALLVNLILTSIAIIQIEGTLNPNVTSFADALWISIVTMATVGYGEVVPITTAGRFFCLIGGVLGGLVFNSLLRVVFVDALIITLAEEDTMRTITERADTVCARDNAAAVMQTIWRCQRASVDKHKVTLRLHALMATARRMRLASRKASKHVRKVLDDCAARVEPELTQTTDATSALETLIQKLERVATVLGSSS
ncbi:hypothetical protein SPRG_10530 [Saprolegnia parasitica CBS 223.65]|uniref:Potassium channel domain-containing protein n=1 Tax=Saprolegnia parasitica (strain CBS 223.65) TaxID=695850 RepID=A0A067BZS0_SAPPC|nr:hypothetical protein SPRG_10530 [Saprolegnia parasitica CBS 223.65]KDO23753.1 hypothetical protein SPRG_10530 [Saprolegnia parasitica CBS 223.65]|eukprot:XP_012205569.1 hypothetical protein SPRG_10530 [Saprolegnia parasitica CBS 223.65]